MFENLKLVLRSYTSLYGIFMSASLTLFSYIGRVFLLAKIWDRKIQFRIQLHYKQELAHILSMLVHVPIGEHILSI